jgi:hypothetical protein
VRFSAYLLPFVTCLAFVLSGCQTTTVVPANGATAPKLKRETSIYIMTPRDGHSGDVKYPGSGDSVVGALEAALSHYVENVIVGSPTETKTDALEAAKMKRCTYLIIPEIKRWESGASKWPGGRDKRELTMKVISVEDGSELRNAEIKGKSSRSIFGGEHSQDLLKEPVAGFVTTLFN